jgi:molybdopterin converting factor subunit 1
MESFRVELFASFADLFGASHLEVSLPRGATVSDLAVAIHNLPSAESLPPRLVVAVNSSYARPETVLAAGDEVALIPPVAGG